MFGSRAGTGGVEWGMLEEPNKLVRLAGRNGGRPRFHDDKRRFIGDRGGFDAPFDRWAGDRYASGGECERSDFVARIDHSLTIQSYIVLRWPIACTTTMLRFTSNWQMTR